MGRAEHVDAVVVGSGFGGSVTALRLAEAGRSVVVLERGRAYPPGTFARSPYEMSHAFWEPEDELLGLFDIRSFRKLEAIVSSGLGGGSLIYANVLLRKDEKWFVHDSPLPGGGYENWPIGRSDLDRHYDAVEAMMTPTPNPYDDIPKAKALRDAAAALGLQTFAPPLAISFAARPGGEPLPKQVVEEPAYGNIHDVTRLTCRLCGECDIGCNEGSKNTLDHNYLSAAKHHGADIRTLCDVSRHHPARRRRLRGALHALRRPRQGRDPQPFARDAITCDQLLLGAGTFGTTSLLLRNRIGLPALGRALGSRFSGNGDLLTFCFGAQAPTRSGMCGSSTPRTALSSPLRCASPTASTKRAPAAGTTCRRRASPTSRTGSSRRTQLTASARRAAECREAAHRLPAERPQ